MESTISTRSSFGFLALALMCTPSLRADELPPALKKVPPDTAFFAHIWVEDLWKHPNLQEFRAGVRAMRNVLDQDFSRSFGVKFSDLVSVTLYIPKLTTARDTDRYVVIFTTRQPYDREAIHKLVRPYARPIDVPGFLALDTRSVAHFTSPTVLAIMDRRLAKEYLAWESSKKQGRLADVIGEAASRKHLATAFVNPEQLPPDTLVEPFRPIMRAKTLVGYLDAKAKSVEAMLRIDTGNDAVTRGTVRALEVLLSLADQGLQLAKNEADEEPDPQTKKLRQSLLDYGKAIHQSTNITRDENRVTLAAKLTLDDSIDKSLLGCAEYVQQTAASISSQNNLVQLALSIYGYADKYNGSVPPAIIMDKRGKPLLSWRVTILPYIGEEELYKQFKLDEPWDSEHNKKLLAKMPKVFDNPRVKNDDDTLTHYRVFVGPSAGFDRVLIRGIPRSYPDGVSNTIMIIEAAKAVPWTKPEPLEYDPKLPIDKLRAMFLFKHGRCNVALFDGSEHTIKESLSEPTLRRAITRNDGLPLLADWNQ